MMMLMMMMMMMMMMMSSTSPRNCFVQNDPNDFDAKRTRRTIWRFVSSMSRDVVRPFGRARGVLSPCRERERESVRVRCFSKMEEKYLRKRWGKCPQISRTRLAAKKKKKKKKATKENDDRGGPPDENFRLAPGLDRRRALQSGGRSRRAIALERRRCQL